MYTKSMFSRLFPGNMRPAPLQNSLRRDSKMSSVGFLSAGAPSLESCSCTCAATVKADFGSSARTMPYFAYNH